MYRELDTTPRHVPICQSLHIASSRTAWMMKERPRRLRVQHMDNQAPVLSYSATKSIECASPRPSYRNEPASLAIDPFPQRGSVPTFQSGCLTPQLYRSHHEQSISRRSFFVRGMFSLSGDWYSTPRFGGPFSGKVYFADRVSMMGSPIIGSYHLSMLLQVNVLFRSESNRRRCT